MLSFQLEILDFLDHLIDRVPGNVSFHLKLTKRLTNGVDLLSLRLHGDTRLNFLERSCGIDIPNLRLLKLVVLTKSRGLHRGLSC